MVFAVKSTFNNKYIVFEDQMVQHYSFLGAFGETVKDAYAQFEHVNSRKHPGLIHIRCRYNNKYWVRISCDQYWIVAAADKPDENTSNWTCTLFKRVYLSDSTQKFRLLHVELGQYLHVADFGNASYLFAGATEAEQNIEGVFTFVNLNLLFMNRSRCVAFKSDDGKYLGATTHNGLPLLQFCYDNVNDPEVKHEMFVTPAGIYYIRSIHHGKFWRSGAGGWILADLDHPRNSNNRNSMFRATHIDTNVIALYDLWSERYIKRFNHMGITAGLNCATHDVDTFSMLEVIDLKGDDDYCALVELDDF